MLFSRTKFKILILMFMITVLGFTAANSRAEDAQKAEQDKAAQTAYVLEVRGAIGPAVTDYIKQTLKLAHNRDADLAIIKMHTPGGLVTAMQDIIQEILASDIPVATFVSPSGSHAASAGTYILYASHIAAMAPATNLGAATPVSMKGGTVPEKSQDEDSTDDSDGDKDAKNKKTKKPRSNDQALELKSVNDAVAYIRGLAELRNRNADWAEKAVREAVSLNAKEAKRQNIIDIIAEDLDDLAEQMNGKTVTIKGKDHTIQSSDINFVEAKPNWRTKILMIITDPNVAFFFMTIGFYGLIYEFANPGAMVPGIVGVICICIGLFALNVLPVNYAGLVLLLIGIGLMTAESFVPSFGILGIAGAISFAIGGTILIETDILGFGGVSWELIATMTGISVLLMIIILSMVVKAHKRRVETGDDAMIGSKATVKEWSGKKGVVLSFSEDWTAYSEDTLKVKKGDEIYIHARDGAKLKVSVNPLIDINEDV